MANASTMKSIITTIDAILGSHDVDFSEVIIYKVKEQQELIKKKQRDIDALNEIIDNASKAQSRPVADDSHEAVGEYRG